MASSRGLVVVIATALLACKAVPELEFDHGQPGPPVADASLDVPDDRNPADATVYGEDAGSQEDAGSSEDAGAAEEDAGTAEEDAGACGTAGGPSCYCGSRICVGSGCPQHCNLCASECQNVCCIRVKPNGVPQAKCPKSVDKCKW